MAVRAPPPRRRRNASLGQIPLSSGEIELYSRQDEAARRRQRLLAVRDQERRLAQQVTQRYRQNLQRLQRGKSNRRQRQLSAEQRKLLTELHTRYQSSLQSMGAAQRNARLKLLELMETAHDERQKWAFNAQITGQQRVNEAEEDREQQQQKRTERRRRVEQNVERLKVLTIQQRRQASARARQEQQLATQRAKHREEIERLRREQSPEEVFVTPRPRGKDVLAYRFTRTHCVAPSVETGDVERTAVTVIRHNRKHPTAVYGEQEAEKYRREMDRKRERDRLVVEQQHEIAADRGSTALEDVTSRQQGKQALEWLALVDKMERRARGQDFGGDDVALDVRDVDGRGDDPERMAERAFARMLGLDEDSVELSAFSIETDDDRSVGLGDTDHEHSDGDKVAEAAADTDREQLDGDKAAEANVDFRVKLKAAKRSEYFDPLLPARLDLDTKDTQAGATPAKKAKAASFGDLKGPSEDEEGGEADIHRSSIGSNDAHPWVSNPYAWYRQQFDGDKVAEADKAKLTATKRSDSFGPLHELGRVRTSSYTRHAGVSNGSNDEDSHEEISAPGRQSSHLVSGEEDQRSESESSFAPSQKSLSHFDQVVQGSGQKINAPGRQSSHLVSGERDQRSESESSFAPSQKSLSHFDQVVQRSGQKINAPGRQSSHLVSGERDQRSESESSFAPSQKSLSHFDQVVQRSGEEINALGRQSSRLVSGEEYQRSESELSFAPSQKSLSHLDQVVNNRAKSLGQRFIDQHMLSFSSSEGQGDGEEDDEVDLHRPSIGSNDAHPSVNINPYDPYRQQIDHQVRRSSTSAVSIAQFSLPPSDTQTSFDGSVHPGYGEDSFVNELVPIFPKRAQPPPPRSQDDDSQVLEEYDVQLVAPNMSRMLTADQRSSFGRSRQRLAHQEHQAAATEHSRSQAEITTARGVKDSAVFTRSEKRVLSSSRRRSISSNSESFDYEIDAKSFVEEPLARHQLDSMKQIRRDSTAGSPPSVHHVAGGSKFDIADTNAADHRSDISSDSGVSSLGFTVQLNLAAGISRKRNGDGGRREVSRPSSFQQGSSMAALSDDEKDDQSNVSEQSFASSSSLSMDARFNYLANMTSAVGKSLPLHLRLPAMIYGKKDMTKPPAPIAWSASSVSSIASVSDADPNDGLEIFSRSDRRTTSRSSSSMSESLLEEQHASPLVERNSDQQVHENSSQQSPTSSYRSKAFDESSEFVGGQRAIHFTFHDIKEKVSRLPPPPLGPLNMSKPPAPLQNLNRSIPDSDSSSEQSFQVSERSRARRHLDRRPNEGEEERKLTFDGIEENVSMLPPPLLGSLDMSRPPAPLQSLNRSTAGSDSSSEQSSPASERSQVRHRPVRRPYEGEEERKLSDSISDSDASSRSEASLSSSSSSSRRHSVKKAEKIVIPVNKSNNDGDSDGGQDGKGMSLAEAFQRRHPGFGRRVESHQEKLRRQRNRQQDPEHEQQYQHESDQKPATKRDTSKGSGATVGSRGATDPLPPEKQQMLDRLASGSRAKISDREMKERSRRLYHQLPEVVERKRQEEVMRRRRERLNELREQEKERRLQQKQRRQQQHQHHR